MRLKIVCDSAGQPNDSLYHNHFQSRIIYSEHLPFNNKNWDVYSIKI